MQKKSTSLLTAENIASEHRLQLQGTGRWGGGTEEIKWIKNKERFCEECLNPEEIQSKGYCQITQ